MVYKKIFAILCAVVLVVHSAPLHSSAAPKSDAAHKYMGTLFTCGAIAAIATGIGFYWWKKQRVSKPDSFRAHVDQARLRASHTPLSQPAAPAIVGNVKQHTDGLSIEYPGCCTEYIWDNGSYCFYPVADQNARFQIEISDLDPVEFDGTLQPATRTHMKVSNLGRTRDGGISGHPHLQGPVGGWPKPWPVQPERRW